MMNNIILTNKFKRSYKKFVKNNQQIQNVIDNIIFKLEMDIYDNSLKSHKLSGHLKGLYACHCGYDCRVIFKVFKSGDSLDIILIDIGTHDEVY